MTDPSPDCGHTDAERAQMDVPWVLTPMRRLGSYKLLDIQQSRPRSWREAMAIAWGLDIFVYRIPLLKMTLTLNVLLNVVFWWLLS